MCGSKCWTVQLKFGTTFNSNSIYANIRFHLLKNIFIVKTSNALWLFLQKIPKRYKLHPPNALPNPILLESGVVDNKEQTNIIR